MFEVNGVYANRKGKYTVLALNPPKMTVRFEDGTVADLKIDLQARIWENIAVEFEVKETSRQKRAANRRIQSNETSYYIKVISVPSTTEMAFPGWPERVVMAPARDSNIEIKSGDRIIFFAKETRTFFAVATITGEAKTADPKDYFYNVELEKANFYPIDIDASAVKLEQGAHVDSVELESQPKFKRLRLEAEKFLVLNEDDFELLAELLTEVVEDADEELDDDDEIYDEEDDD